LENSDLWQKYQTTVLQNGAIKSMSELFQELLSRKPDPSKLLKLSGIKN
jgi:Zn-dependent oligopeptidase